MSFILLGILNSQAAGGGALYYVHAQNQNSTNSDTPSAHLNSDGDVILGNRSFGYSPYAIIQTKIDKSTGTILWKTGLQSTGNLQNRRVCADASGNTYHLMYDQGDGNAPYVVKRNSSGTIQWQKKIIETTPHSIFPFSISCNAAGDTAIGVRVSGSNTELGYISLNSGGGQLANSGAWLIGTNLRPGVIGIDDSRNVYIADEFVGNYIVKFNSSGNLVWQRSSSVSIDATPQTSGIEFDSSGNLYIGADPGNGGIIKFDSSGTVIWGRQESGSSSSQGVWVDELDNVFLLGGSELYKFDTSGNSIWKRSFNSVGYGVAANADAIVVGAYGSSSTPDHVGLYYYPQNGSITTGITLEGNTYSIGVQSSTTSSFTPTWSSSSLLQISNNLTVTNGSLSSFTPTITEYLGELG